MACFAFESADTLKLIAVRILVFIASLIVPCIIFRFRFSIRVLPLGSAVAHAVGSERSIEVPQGTYGYGSPVVAGVNPIL